MEFVVLGLGSIGRRHAENLLALKCQVLGFDTDQERCKSFEAAGGRSTSRREEAMAAAANGGAIIVASPSGQHHADVLEAIDIGCHLFVEKPFVHRLDGIEEALKAAECAGQIIFAAHNLRYHPAVESAHAVLSAGELGQIFWARAICGSYLPDWRPNQDYRTGYAANPMAGGVIFDIVHEFDLSAYLLGPFRVKQAIGNQSGFLELSSEDIADIVLQHDSGARNVVHVDYLTRPPIRVMDIAGENGRLSVDIIRRRVRHWRADGEIVLDESAASKHEDDYRFEMAQFLSCIEGETEPRCDGFEAFAVLREVISARDMAGLPSSDTTG